MPRGVIVKAAEIIQRIISLGLKPLAKRCGFRKSGLNFYRRLGEVVQVINIQLSHSNYRSEGAFYVNVGLAFDGLWRTVGQPIPERPKEYQCHFRSRLELLVPEAPPRWSVSELTDRADMGRELARLVEVAVAELDQVSSAAEFLRHPWLAGGGDPILIARLHYSLGDHWSALEALRRAVSNTGREAEGLKAIIQRYGLVALEWE
jgi:hypothetical protein